MSKIGSFTCALVLASTLIAQENLIPNGSFEDTKGKVKRAGSISMAENWTSATGVKADLYVNTKEPGFGTPDNMYGTENPKEGSNYAGIVAFSYGDKLPRTYLQTRLTEPMKKGQKYCVQYNLSLAEGSKYASNKLGAMFSKKELESDSKASLIEEKPSVQSDEIFNALFGWNRVCDTYTAEGGEKYIVIGNFTSNENTKNEKSKPSKGVKVESIIAAYYYIDEVSVVLIEDDVVCDCGTPDESANYSTLIFQKQINVDAAKNTPKQIIEAQELYFGFGQDRLTPITEAALDIIADILMKNPNMKLQVNAHSDEMEDEIGAEKEAYADMDDKRIAAVFQYLKTKEVANSRLIASPQGSEIANPNILDQDEEEVAQAKNRRVMFVVR